jgi:hypothetical protein
MFYIHKQMFAARAFLAYSSTTKVWSTEFCLHVHARRRPMGLACGGNIMRGGGLGLAIPRHVTSLPAPVQLMNSCPGATAVGRRRHMRR